MRVPNWISFVCIMIAIAIGVAIAIMLSDIATVKAGWCGERPHCLRDWIGAFSGWAAAAGAGATIWVLYQTLAHMRATSEQQLRAYVSEEVVEINGVGTGHPYATCTIKNYGMTPARNLHLSGYIWIGDEGAATPTMAGQISKEVGDVAPGQIFSGNLAFWQALDQTTVSDIAAGNSTINFGLVYRYDTVGVHVRRAKLFVNRDNRIEDGPMMFRPHPEWQDSAVRAVNGSRQGTY